MIKTIKKLLIPISILVIVGFFLFLINQVSGIYLMLQSFNQLVANIVLGVLSLGMFALVLWPILMFSKLPKPLHIPENETELEAYRKKLFARLRKNKLLISESATPNSIDDLDRSLDVLHGKADLVIRQTATAVFLTTSVSQNGKLDALTILATQSRMVWKIAHIYYQRPTMRELVYLYANVAASSFLAAEIEDLDISQQVEPVISSFIRNAGGKSVPVLGPTANIILDSMLEGSTNAFLTLRVGNITKKYCGVNEVITKKQIKRGAFMESAKQLKGIVMKSSGEIISGLVKATKKAGVDTLKSGWEGIKNTGGKVVDGVSEVGQKINPFKKKEGVN